MKIKINRGIISIPTIISYIIHNAKCHFNIGSTKDGILVTLDDGKYEEHEIDADSNVIQNIKELLNEK